MSDDLLWVEFGKIYTKLGDLDDAIAAFLKALDLNPDSGLAYCNLAYAYHRKGDYGKAVALYRKSIPMINDPKEQALAWNNLGNTYRVLRDLENANMAYQKADALEMDLSIGVKCHDLLGKLNDRSTSSEQQLSSDLSSTAQHAQLSTDPTPDSNSLFSACAEQEKDKKMVIGRFVSYPSSLENKEQIGTAEVAMGTTSLLPASKPDETINPSPQSVKRAQPCNDKELQEQSPDVKELKEKNDPALEEILSKVKIYENITRANPMNDRAWDTLGKFYKSLGRFSDAIAAYQNAINVVPSKEVYHYYLGLLHAVEKQYDNAVREFSEVIRINPDYVLAHSALAGLYRRLGMQAKANQHISIAMPKMQNESTYNRACFYATCGDIELAIEFLHLALQNNDTTIDWIKSDPDLDQLREDPRFQLLIDENNSIEGTGQNYLSARKKTDRTMTLELLNSSMAR